MDILIRLGLTNNQLKDMLEIYPEISILSYEELLSHIELLRNINLTEEEIKEILIVNPFFLSKTYIDIYKLIMKLTMLGIDDINSIVTINPFLLNKEVYEIDEYINIGIRKGNSVQKIIEQLEENPYLIEEI